MSALTAAPAAYTIAPRATTPRSTTPGRTTPRLRLTRRGRAVLTTLAAAPLVIAAVISGLSGGGANASLQDSSATFTYVTVAPGQSLWSVAETIAPNADPREVVADIVSLNQLASGDVQAGERIAIPTEYADSAQSAAQ